MGCSAEIIQLSALACISSFMKPLWRRQIMKSFISWLFSYCPLAWFFCIRGINGRINRICERAIRTFYNDKFSTFKELREKYIFVSTHQPSIHQLSPTWVWEKFKLIKSKYNLWRNTIFESRPFLDRNI